MPNYAKEGDFDIPHLTLFVMGICLVGIGLGTKGTMGMVIFDIGLITSGILLMRAMSLVLR